MNQIVSGIQFNVGARYEVKKLLGAGAYGHVALAIDKKQTDPEKQKVAIKKLHLVRDEIDAKRVLREIRILRTMQHENILHLENLIYDDSNKELEFGEIYLVTNYLEVDLYKIIKSGQNLTDQHYQYIIYQLLKGLKYLHSASIVHRDIKPSNILATENCEICYCDFGLARQIEELEAEDNRCQNMLTEYVVTRYYRAPEVMLSSHEYSTAIDIWSLGCTFAELITKQILFKGTNYIQMIKLIFDTLGKPQDEDLQFITNSNAKKYVNSLQTKMKCSIGSVIKYTNPHAIDLLDKMLEINPKKRITSAEALNHPYLESIRDPDDEPSFEGHLDSQFENDSTILLKDLKVLILNELNLMKQINNEPLINIQLEVEKREQIVKINQQKKQQLKQQQQQQ
ncbi:unnamed protein product (macronuclear) [Paramecium tetraurelia]|uniref:Protein kinase domain-containing protein n=1 Tax=Paramecium tetraurelia TaxID=5888 RepID=A0EF00_PARTE|nr:uncharacterized protein GSPATT00026214001 [Paramecium tetraurelia]CAK93891.1 unnamed protein product [Paramecium tetraurelia]|eukprot:XP_001461264.1 hypothetical protein (macronuclear) [Paramecium tetraurelia strain d4-2]